MSDEIQEEDVVVEEQQIDEENLTDEDIEIVEDEDSTRDYSKDLDGLSSKLKEQEQQLNLAERIDSGFNRLGENLEKAITRSTPAQQQQVDPDISWYDNLSDEEAQNAMITDSKNFLKKQEKALTKKIEQKFNGALLGQLDAMNSMYLATKESDPNWGSLIKDHKDEIMQAIRGMSPEYRSNPAVLDNAINMVKGKYADEYLGSKRSSSNNTGIKAPTIATRGGAGSGAGKIQFNPRDYFSDSELENFRLRGISSPKDLKVLSEGRPRRKR